MLLKGIVEVEEAGRPLAAAEMVLVRMAYAADLPTPDEVIRSLDGSGAAAPARAGGGDVAGGPVAASRFEAARFDAPRGAPRAALAAQPTGALSSDPDAAPNDPPLAIANFEELIALAAKRRDLAVKAALERDVRLVRCEDGRLEIALEASAAKTLVHDLARKFSQWTNRRWMVVVSAESGQPTVKSQADARQAELQTGVRANPLVQAVLTRFPGAEIVGVRAPEATAALPGDDPDEMPEPPPADDGSYGADWRDDEPRDE
jgi:DNA polymerase-3 subunit gamma/tau